MKEYFSYYQGGAGDHRPFKVFGATREERDRVAAHIGAYPVDMKEYQKQQKELNRKPPFFTQRRLDIIMMAILWGSLIGGAICQFALMYIEHLEAIGEWK
jgi:hypothetical protein